MNLLISGDNIHAIIYPVKQDKFSKGLVLITSIYVSENGWTFNCISNYIKNSEGTSEIWWLIL